MILPGFSANDPRCKGTLLQDPDNSTTYYCELGTALIQGGTFEPLALSDAISDPYAGYFASNLGNALLDATHKPGIIVAQVLPELFADLEAEDDPFRSLTGLERLSLLLRPQYFNPSTESGSNGSLLQPPVQLNLGVVVANIEYYDAVTVDGFTSKSLSVLELMATNTTEIILRGPKFREPDPDADPPIDYQCGFVSTLGTPARLPSAIVRTVFEDITLSGRWVDSTHLACSSASELLEGVRDEYQVLASDNAGKTFSLPFGNAFGTYRLCPAHKVDLTATSCGGASGNGDRGNPDTGSGVNDSNCSSMESCRCYLSETGVGTVSFCNGNGACNLNTGECVCDLGIFGPGCSFSCATIFDEWPTHSCEQCTGLHPTQCVFCSWTETCGAGCPADLPLGTLLQFSGTESPCPAVTSAAPPHLQLDGFLPEGGPSGSGSHPHVKLNATYLNPSLQPVLRCLYVGVYLTRGRHGVLFGWRPERSACCSCNC